MKIRKGFVSNSSSTSFSVYGIGEDNETLLEMLNTTSGNTVTVDEDEYVDWYETFSTFNLQGLEITTGDDYSYVGVSWDELGDDETGAQFKTRVNDLLVSVFGAAVNGKAENHYGEVCTG